MATPRGESSAASSLISTRMYADAQRHQSMGGGESAGSVQLMRPGSGTSASAAVQRYKEVGLDDSGELAS